MDALNNIELEKMLKNLLLFKLYILIFTYFACND